MSVRTTESPLRTLRRLWKRAPAWRLTGLAAALLTALCLLFPPDRAVGHHGAAAAVSPAARYTPQPAAAPSAMQATAPAATAVTAPATAPPVQTAILSLATPDSHGASADELDNAVAGRRISGSLRVDGFDVPLPPGDWLQLANARFKQSTADGEMLMLGRVKNRRLVGYVRITAGRSTSAPGAGFRATPGCDHKNENTNVLVNEASEPFGHQACWLLDHSFLAPLQAWADRSNKLPPLERAAAGDLAAKGVSYPQEMISLRFTRAETWGLLEVRYVFSPEEDHITSSNVASYTDSDWQPGTIGRYPEKVAYVAKLKQWGDDFWPRFKLAFDAGQRMPSR
ncbi:hypothetical protein [Dyella sp. C9]|uniref:hypothetical protein n=1 Tax=Dyella sp. C9 TaxID=2202154 RepID=UPI001300423D|nr:hypothetical protein [Dyella sp. C9]